MMNPSVESRIEKFKELEFFTVPVPDLSDPEQKISYDIAVRSHERAKAMAMQKIIDCMTNWQRGKWGKQFRFRRDLETVQKFINLKRV